MGKKFTYYVVAFASLVEMFTHNRLLEFEKADWTIFDVITDVFALALAALIVAEVVAPALRSILWVLRVIFWHCFYGVGKFLFSDDEHEYRNRVSASSLHRFALTENNTVAWSIYERHRDELHERLRVLDARHLAVTAILVNFCTSHFRIFERHSLSSVLHWGFVVYAAILAFVWLRERFNTPELDGKIDIALVGKIYLSGYRGRLEFDPTHWDGDENRPQVVPKPTFGRAVSVGSRK